MLMSQVAEFGYLFVTLNEITTTKSPSDVNFDVRVNELSETGSPRLADFSAVPTRKIVS